MVARRHTQVALQMQPTMTWMHPMVCNAICMVTASDLRLYASAVPEASALFAGVYLLRCPCRHPDTASQLTLAASSSPNRSLVTATLNGGIWVLPPSVLVVRVGRNGLIRRLPLQPRPLSSTTL